MDAGRGKDTSILQAREAAGRLSFAPLAAWREDSDAAFPPDPSIGRRCHELRVADEKVSWRIVYRIDEDAIVILEVFSKKTGKTPKSIIDICRTRLREYDHG